MKTGDVILLVAVLGAGGLVAWALLRPPPSSGASSGAGGSTLPSAPPKQACEGLGCLPEVAGGFGKLAAMF